MTRLPFPVLLGLAWVLSACAEEGALVPPSPQLLKEPGTGPRSCAARVREALETNARLIAQMRQENLEAATRNLTGLGAWYPALLTGSTPRRASALDLTEVLVSRRFSRVNALLNQLPVEEQATRCRWVFEATFRELKASVDQLWERLGNPPQESAVIDKPLVTARHGISAALFLQACYAEPRDVCRGICEFRDYRGEVLKRTADKTKCSRVLQFFLERHCCLDPEVSANALFRVLERQREQGLDEQAKPWQELWHRLESVRGRCSSARVPIHPWDAMVIPSDPPELRSMEMPAPLEEWTVYFDVSEQEVEELVELTIRAFPAAGETDSEGDPRGPAAD